MWSSTNCAGSVIPYFNNSVILAEAASSNVSLSIQATNDLDRFLDVHHFTFNEE